MTDGSARTTLRNGRDEAEETARDLTRDPRYRAVVRGGIGARGVLFVTLGLLIGRLALGDHSGEQASPTGALEELARQPFGTALLVVLAVGFLGYVVLSAVDLLVYSDNAGTRLETRLHKLAAVGRMVVYLAALAFVVRLLVAHRGSDGDEEQALTGRLLQSGVGRVVVAAAGLMLLAIAARFAVKAAQRSFCDALDGRQPSWVSGLGAVGHWGRAGATALVGIFVVAAAVTADAEKSDGLDGALRDVARTPWGPWALLVLAVAVIAFGVYLFTEARYRRLDAHAPSG